MIITDQKQMTILYIVPSSSIGLYFTFSPEQESGYVVNLLVHPLCGGRPTPAGIVQLFEDLLIDLTGLLLLALELSATNLSIMGIDGGMMIFARQYSSTHLFPSLTTLRSCKMASLMSRLL